jgi:hypothetical protein
MRKEELITWAGPRSGLMSQVVQQEALTRLLVEKGIYKKKGTSYIVSVKRKSKKKIKPLKTILEKKRGRIYFGVLRK